MTPSKNELESIAIRRPAGRRSSVALLLLACLSPTVASPLAADERPDEHPGGQAEQRTGRKLAALPRLAIGDTEESHHRLFETIHGARMLAEAGAGHESARVLAAIARQFPDTEPGNEASNVLKEWGLTIDQVLAGDADEIGARIARAMDGHRKADAGRMHARNLVELERYAEAAHLMLDEPKAREAEAIDRAWGEILHHYRLPLELLQDDSEGTARQLSLALQTSHQRRLQHRNVRILRAFDPEASELADMLLRRTEPRGRGTPDDDRRERSPFERFVEGEEREAEQRERERERLPEVAELAPRIVRRAARLADGNRHAARMLASLVVQLAPGSAAAARTLLERLAAPVDHRLRRKLPEAHDLGAILFNSKQVRRYQLELSDHAVQQLREEPKRYVRATFREGDAVYQDVGVRLKGGHGSFRMLDGESKAAFTVKFNQFRKQQRFHGLRRIILNNSVQDPSYLHEYIGYGLFRDAGIPAPRIGHASLRVNGQPFGLYVLVEAVSGDFLKHWYEKASGNLYEGPGDVVDWRELDIDSNQGREDRSDLRRLAEALETADDDDPWQTLSELVDTDLFARFLALEQLVGHWDGYTQTNNYRLYRNPLSSKFEFLPHGADQLFEEIGGDIFRQQGGILGRALVQSKAGKKRYQSEMQQLLDQVWDETSIRERIAEAYLRLRPQVEAASRGHRLEEFEHRVHRLLRFVAIRRYVVQLQLRAAKQRSWRERHHFGHHSFLHSGRDW